jgi:hypothetical protein
LGDAAAGDDLAAAVDLDPADDGSGIENAAAAEERAADDRDAPEPIVPVLVTPPLKVVWLITIAVA